MEMATSGLKPLIIDLGPKPRARVSVAEAAKLMECSELYLRVAIQRGLYDFGTCTKISGGRYTYYINRAKLMRFLGGE